MDDKKSYEQALEELSLMLMYLTRKQDNNEFFPFKELSWKGYDFDTMDRLEQKELLWQPRSRRGYEKYLYLTEAGRKKARELLQDYGFSDKAQNERFEFRNIRPDEAKEAARVEKICFPPNEACTESIMKERAAVAADTFLVAWDRQEERIAGFLNGLATDEDTLRDEFFKDVCLHDPEGKNIMILGLDVLPEYRGQGLAKALMFEYLRREWDRGRKMIILTCLKEKIRMYEKMGFINRGLSKSCWGGEQWYEMRCVLNM